MRERRHHFSAWMVLEVGKSWGEADADTAEAIDFMEFYAREMLRYDAPRRAHPDARARRTRWSTCRSAWAPIIPPWNFPLAICVGMTTRRDRHRQHGGA